MDYVMVRPSLLSTLAFLAVVVAVAMAFPAGVWAGTLRACGPSHARRSALRACGATLAVLALSAALAQSGVLQPSASGAGLMAYFVACTAGAVALALSALGQRLALALPLYALVGFHVFRLPLEFVLHQWYMEGVLPVQMTYAGANFDVVTGLLALLVAPLMYLEKLSRRAAWFFNVVGTALLVNLASIALRSSPVPLRSYMNEPPVLLALYAPYTWILPVCVAGALFGHLLIFRHLLSSEAELLGASGA